MSLHSAISALLHGEQLDSCIDPTETVVFFPTCASLAGSEGGRWQIPIHGWIYQPTELSRLRRAALRVAQRVARLRFGLTHLAAPVFAQRVGAFLSDNERNNRVQVEFAGAGRRFTLGKSRPNGHFEGLLELDDAQVRELLAPDPIAPRSQITTGQWLTFRAITRSSDPRHFDGRVLFLPPEGLSVISDIDDTIKVTEVLDRRSMIQNTFLREFASVPQMAELYRRWERERGAAFHYVSASPWHLYPFLAEFIAAQDFPPGSFHLRDFRLMPRDLSRSLRPSWRAKQNHARALLSRFPARRFILIGDSGESDPRMYAALAREFPHQVDHIYIRNITSHPPEWWQATFAGLPQDLWRLFQSPSELMN